VEGRLTALQTQVHDLEQQRVTCAAENHANLAPRRIVLRMDAGFATAEHIAWLDEQEYSVIARAHAPHVALCLHAETDLRWSTRPHTAAWRKS